MSIPVLIAMAVIFALMVGGAICLFQLVRKSVVKESAVKEQYAMMAYISTLVSLLAFLTNFGYQAATTMFFFIPYLVWFFVSSVRFGKYAEYYPEKMIRLNPWTHVTLSCAVLLLPDQLVDELFQPIEGSLLAFFGLFQMPDGLVAQILTSAAYVLFIIHVVLFVRQFTWKWKEDKELKKILGRLDSK